MAVSFSHVKKGFLPAPFTVIFYEEEITYRRIMACKNPFMCIGVIIAYLILSTHKDTVTLNKKGNDGVLVSVRMAYTGFVSKSVSIPREIAF